MGKIQIEEPVLKDKRPPLGTRKRGSKSKALGDQSKKFMARAPAQHENTKNCGPSQNSETKIATAHHTTNDYHQNPKFRGGPMSAPTPNDTQMSSPAHSVRNIEALRNINEGDLIGAGVLCQPPNDTNLTDLKDMTANNDLILSPASPSSSGLPAAVKSEDPNSKYPT